MEQYTGYILNQYDVAWFIHFIYRTLSRNPQDNKHLAFRKETTKHLASPMDDVNTFYFNQKLTQTVSFDRYWHEEAEEFNVKRDCVL